MLTESLRRLRSLVRGGREDAEMQQELHFHLEIETEKNLAAGLSPLEARRQAHLRLGGMVPIQEAVRDARGVRPLADLLRDIGLTLRSLRRSPLFTAVTVGAGDGDAGSARVAVLTHELWQRRYGSDPSVLGRVITLDDEPVEIVGVLPDSFRFPRFTDLTPMGIWGAGRSSSSRLPGPRPRSKRPACSTTWCCCACRRTSPRLRRPSSWTAFWRTRTPAFRFSRAHTCVRWRTR